MKGMKVHIARNGKTLALTRPQKMFAQDRTTMETAYAGDGKLLIAVSYGWILSSINQDTFEDTICHKLFCDTIT